MAAVETLAQIHSIVRWLVLLAGLAAAVMHAAGLLRRTAYGRNDRVAGAIYAGVLDAQALLGLALLIGLAVVEDDLPPAGRILHAATMFFAVAAAHQTARWREADDARRYRNGLIAYCLSLALVAGGIAVIAQPP